ncbi:tetratricopeptide repeat protein [Parabacteroides sp. OttesenSCG-928-N08]|nr:tetratricopeptide repeat protein [Parabacteroides sp. OttesenSCG-928-N08]
MFLKNLFNKSGDQLAREAIEDYNNNKDEFTIIEKLQKTIKLGIKHYPLDQIYLHIGACYYDLSLHEKAKEAYEKAYEINPKNATVISNLGLSHYQLGMPKRALQFYFEALKINPNHSYSYHHIGLYYYEHGMHFEALEYLDKALEIKSNLTMAHSVKARCLSYIGNKEEALRYLQSAKKCGYENGINLRNDIDYVCSRHPNLFWNKEKFIELSTNLSNNNLELLNNINWATEKPYHFFKENPDSFFTKDLTSFEINNIIPITLLLNYLYAEELLVIVEQDYELHSLIESVEKLLRKFADVNGDFFHEFYTIKKSHDIDDLIVSIASKIKITFNLETIDIWYNEAQLFLTMIKVDDWQKIQYPFSDTEDGFGRIRCIATEHTIKTFLTNS